MENKKFNDYEFDAPKRLLSHHTDTLANKFLYALKFKKDLGINDV